MKSAEADVDAVDAALAEAVASFSSASAGLCAAADEVENWRFYVELF